MNLIKFSKFAKLFVHHFLNIKKNFKFYCCDVQSFFVFMSNEREFMMILFKNDELKKNEIVY